MVVDRGEDDVGRHSLELGGGAAGAVKFADGDFERAEIVGAAHDGAEVEQGLHGALAVGGDVADDQRASVILQGAGQNFRGRSAEAAGQDDQRAVVKHGGIGVLVHGDLAIRIPHLDDGAFLDEQAGEVDGFLEGTAAIAPEIKDHAADFFFH